VDSFDGSSATYRGFKGGLEDEEVISVDFFPHPAKKTETTAKAAIRGIFIRKTQKREDGGKGRWRGLLLRSQLRG
jgi:hypothetical protein